MTFRKNIVKLVFLVAPAFSFVSVSAQDELALAEIAEHRKKQELEFRDPDKSPLDQKDLKKFKGLKYYAPNLKYRVTATFIKNENPVLFKMKTSTTRLPSYQKYGEVLFSIDSQDFVLEVYQSPDLMKMAGFEDHLFIPFTDKTNGNETYDVGRYLELRIPTSDKVIVDFNQCYNPYCSYSPRFSCPIPPAANSLPIEIKAGEKKYKEHH